MGDEYKDRWYDFLPWILLLKRSSFQKELGASPAMMTYGTNLAIPGDLLRDPGDPMSETEVQKLVQFVNKIDHKVPKTTTNPKPVIEVQEPPSNVTHVYTKQYNTTGLQAPYMGPFPVVERPSRTQVKIQVGVNVKGEPRYELRNWKDLKIAHLRSDATEASRPKRGRPSTIKVKPHSDSDPIDADTSAQSEAANSTDGKSNVNKSLSAESTPRPVEINSNVGGNRPKRSTRNPAPIYVDATRDAGPPQPTELAGISNVVFRPQAWSATQEEMNAINESIVRKYSHGA